MGSESLSEREHRVLAAVAAATSRETKTYARAPRIGEEAGEPVAAITRALAALRDAGLLDAWGTDYRTQWRLTDAGRRRLQASAEFLDRCAAAGRDSVSSDTLDRQPVADGGREGDRA